MKLLSNVRIKLFRYCETFIHLRRHLTTKGPAQLWTYFFFHSSGNIMMMQTNAAAVYLRKKKKKMKSIQCRTFCICILDFEVEWIMFVQWCVFFMFVTTFLGSKTRSKVMKRFITLFSICTSSFIKIHSTNYFIHAFYFEFPIFSKLYT